MSPEQVSGGLLDGRTDLYSVGVMLWEMLAHRPLFAGTTKEILGQVMYRDIAPPTSVCPGVPVDLSAVAMKLLARDRDDRYPTAAAVIEALLRCDDAPRDGRGELVHLLAERVPRSSPPRAGVTGPSTASQLDPLITMPEPPSQVAVAVGSSSLRAGAAARPQRRIFAVTLSGVVLGCLAAVLVIAGGEVGQSGTTAGTPAGPPARAMPMARTGGLRISVAPHAWIWLDGELVGQTPFRALVAAGRHQIRLFNGELGRSETTTITVESEQTVNLERSW
jgi:serine/threonine-protein kinase